MRRTGVCGAAETLLVERAGAPRLLKPLIEALIAAGCAVRGDEAARAVDKRVTPASEADWRTEYLDAIISAKVVDGLDAAIAHIETYGSHHTDCIVTEDKAAAETVPQGSRFGDRAAQRLDPVRRRRRIRLRRRDRHRHRPHARPRPGRRRAALHASSTECAATGRRGRNAIWAGAPFCGARVCFQAFAGQISVALAAWPAARRRGDRRARARFNSWSQSNASSRSGRARVRGERTSWMSCADGRFAPIAVRQGT